MSYDVQSVLNIKASLGEGALWHPIKQEFWFVDILSQTINSFNPETKKHTVWKSPERVGFVCPKKSGGFIAGLKSGLHDFDENTGEFKLIVKTDPDYSNNRLNDACVDGKGRLWCGSMDDDHTADIGSIFRFDGELTKVHTGISITNGPAVSPDGKTIYYNDTLGKLVFAADIDEAGNLSNKRLFADLNDQEGFADGPVCDSEGNLWIGLYGGWGVRKYSPEGKLLDFVKFPVANITKIAFGGPDLKTVYATTAADGVPEDKASEQPLAGNVFSFRVDVAGNVQNLFG